MGTSIGLSYFGVAGTLLGLTLGTVVTGAFAWWVEWLIRRASARAAARRRQGRELSPEETSFIAAVADDRHKRNYRPPWQTVALGLSAIFVVAGAILVVVALGAGRPVGAIVRPPAAVRTTPPPSAPPSTQPAVSPTATFSASPSPSPDLVPTTVTPTTASPSPSPSTSATITPTVPATVPATAGVATP